MTFDECKVVFNKFVRYLENKSTFIKINLLMKTFLNKKLMKIIYNFD